MLLYSFRVIGNGAIRDGGLFVDLDIFGDPGDDTGIWTTKNGILGAFSGHWHSGRDLIEPGFDMIVFTKGKRPSALRTLLTGAEYDFRDLLTLQGIMKWPLVKGETGPGLTDINAFDVGWRVLYAHA